MQTTVVLICILQFLILRPEEAAVRFEQEIHARFGAEYPTLRAPLMCMEPVTPKIDWLSFATLIFTSSFAVQAFAALTNARHFACFAVGETTAQTARDIGLKAIDCGGTAEKLIKTVLSADLPGAVLYLRGEHVSNDIAASLALFDIEVQSATIYRQISNPLSVAAVELLQSDRPVIIPLMSARSSELLFDQLCPSAQIFPVAISDKVAKTVPNAFSGSLRTALKPTLTAVLDEVAKQIRDVKRLEGL